MTAAATILGIPVDDVTLAEVVERISVWVEQEPQRLHQIVTTNPEFLVEARRNARFREVLKAADLATADGVGVLIAARILGRPLRARVTGVELVEALARTNDPALKFFLLGAGPGIAERAAAALKQHAPHVVISGVWGGSPRPEDAPEILRRLSEAQASVLFVAYGAPRQDIWIAEQRESLAKCGIVVALGVGGAFDYLAGAVPRAPRFIRRIGLEWLYRLILQPWRWRRQLALPFFVLLVLRQRLRLNHIDHQERAW
ncbi:MAG TPA: WecB/TagA/CpsF family glycosyltransferase [Nitrolancea sp.]|nr:WecB/TagA/CpsF family glycosyltransferase [Nitrolancea sp.]